MDLQAGNKCRLDYGRNTVIGNGCVVYVVEVLNEEKVMVSSGGRGQWMEDANHLIKID